MEDDLKASIPACLHGNDRNFMVSEAFVCDDDISLTNIVGATIYPCDIGTAEDLGHKVFFVAAQGKHPFHQILDGNISVFGGGESFSVPEGKHVVIHASAGPFLIAEANGDA